MQLRHCCNHPFLIKGVQQAEGVDMMDEDMYLECLIMSSGKLVSASSHHEWQPA